MTLDTVTKRGHRCGHPYSKAQLGVAMTPAYQAASDGKRTAMLHAAGCRAPTSAYLQQLATVAANEVEARVHRQAHEREDVRRIEEAREVGR